LCPDPRCLLLIIEFPFEFSDSGLKTCPVMHISTTISARALNCLLGVAVLMPGMLMGQSLAELQAAAKKRDPAAQYQLGRRYLLGIGTAVDEKEGYKFLKQAAEQGSNLEAIHLVGVCLATEAGVKKNEREALKHFEKAALGGHAESQFKLGTCYETGLLSVKPDAATAMKWYLGAAKQGHPRAQYKYAKLVYEIPDASASAEWFRKAAEQGVIEAQIMTGHLYKIGQAPGGKDLVEAYKWYLIASRLGHPEAIKQVEELPKLWERDLNAQGIQKARQRAETFLEQHREIEKAP
jgi:TPR repeat protein